MFGSPGAGDGFNLYDSGQADDVNGDQFAAGALLSSEQQQQPDRLEFTNIPPGSPFLGHMNTDQPHSPNPHLLSPTQQPMSAWHPTNSNNNEGASAEATLQIPPLVSAAQKRRLNSGQTHDPMMLDDSDAPDSTSSPMLLAGQMAAGRQQNSAMASYDPYKKARLEDSQAHWGQAAANPGHSSTGAFTAPMDLLPPNLQLNSQMEVRPLPLGYAAAMQASWSSLSGQSGATSAPTPSNAGANSFAALAASSPLQIQQMAHFLLTGQSATNVPPAAQAPMQSSGNPRPPPVQLQAQLQAHPLVPPAASFRANNSFAPTPLSPPSVQSSGTRPPRVPSVAAVAAAAAAATGAAGMSQPPSAASHAPPPPRRRRTQPDAAAAAAPRPSSAAPQVLHVQSLGAPRAPPARASASSSSSGPSRASNPFVPVAARDDRGDSDIQRQEEQEDETEVPARRRRSQQIVRPGQRPSDPHLTEARLAPATSSMHAQSSGMGSHFTLNSNTLPARSGNKQKKPTELTIASAVIRAEIGFYVEGLDPGDDEPVAYLDAGADLANKSVTADGKYVPMVKEATEGEAMFNEPTIHLELFSGDYPWNNWFAYHRWRIHGRADVFAREQLSTLVVNMKSVHRQEAIAQHKILCQMYAEIDIGEMVPGRELETSTFVRDYFMPLPVLMGPEYRNHLIEPRDVQRIENALFHFARFILDNFPPELHQQIKEKLSRIKYDDPEMSLRRLMRRRIMQVHKVAVETLRDHFTVIYSEFTQTDEAKVLMEKYGADRFLTFHNEGYAKFANDYGAKSAPSLAMLFLAHAFKQFETPKFIRMAMAVVTVEMMSYLLYYTTVSVYHHRAQPAVESPFSKVQGCLARIRDMHARMAATIHGQRFTLYPGLQTNDAIPVTIRIKPTIALRELTSDGHLSNSTGYMAPTAKLPIKANAQGNYHATIAEYMTPTLTMQSALASEFETMHELPELQRQTVEASIRAQFWWKFHSGYVPDMLAFSGLSSSNNGDEEDADWNTESPMAPTTNQVEREQAVMRQLAEQEQQEARNARMEQHRAELHAEARRLALHGGDAASARDIAQQRADALVAQDAEERAAAASVVDSGDDEKDQSVSRNLAAAAPAAAAPAEAVDSDFVEIVDLTDDATARQALLDAQKARDAWSIIVVQRLALVADAESKLLEAVKFNLANKNNEAGKAAEKAQQAVYLAASHQHAESVTRLAKLDKKVSFRTKAQRIAAAAPPRAAAADAAAAQPSDDVPQVKTETTVKKEVSDMRSKIEQQRNELEALKKLFREAQANSIRNEMTSDGARDLALEELDQMKGVLSQRDIELQNLKQTIKDAELEVNKLSETNARVLAERKSLQDQLDDHLMGQSVADPGGLMARIGELDGKVQALAAQSKSAKQKLTDDKKNLNRKNARRAILNFQITEQEAVAAGSSPAAAAASSSSSSLAAVSAAAASDPASSSSAAAAAMGAAASAAAAARTSRSGRPITEPRRLGEP